jgi:hypothetical protein
MADWGVEDAAEKVLHVMKFLSSRKKALESGMFNMCYC